MRKTSVKIKTEKLNVSNPKITDFFQKNIANGILEIRKPKRNEGIIVIHSDDDIIDDTPERITKKQSKSKLFPKKRKSSISECSLPSSSLGITAKNSLPFAKRFCESPKDFIDDEKKNTFFSTPTKQRKGTESSSSTEKKLSEINGKSPRRSKTPTKRLFERTPKKIDEFKVEIIDKFVKITPSKSSEKKENRSPTHTPTKSVEKEKLQSSLLKYMSPSTSTSSTKAQEVNEMTPTKSPQKNKTTTPKSKVKIKLFGELVPLKEENKEHNLSKTVVENKLIDDFLDSSDSEIFNIPFDEMTFLQNSTQNPGNLSLNQSQHCKIVELKQFFANINIKVQLSKSEDFAHCDVKGFWLNVKLKVGDTIHIMAKNINNVWNVDNENGLIVLEPDFLISSTSVVGSLFCKRKSAFSDRMSGFDPPNRAMIIGILVHDLLQTSLKNNLTSSEQVTKLASDLIKSKNTVRKLYEADLAVEEIKEELYLFIPRIVDFISTYVGRKKISKIKNGSWFGVIKSVEDIEENIWCTELGIKGKIDVSIKTDTCHMPLELKTGRATMSLEHKGQVLLYIMMMNKLGFTIPSGLLLYLRDGILKEISMTEKEKRDIIILRNELAFYLLKNTEVVKEDSIKKILPPEFPDPINHHGACSMCPYNTVCTAYLQFNNYDFTKNPNLEKVKDNVLSYLNKPHIDYFVHWSALLSLENSTDTSSKNVREIYTVNPEKRETKGQCIINLKIADIAEEVNGFLDHTFEKTDSGSSVNFLASGIAENQYVVISTDSRPAVISGFVSRILSKMIVVALDKNLQKKHPFTSFHIDTYDSSITYSYNFTNLALLLENTPKCEQLRRLIIDKAKPTFLSKLPKSVAVKGTAILKRLNKIQQRAVLHSFLAIDYILINGMPGTGKTATLVALIELLVLLNKSVLITSHTHAAVDNICLKLIPIGIDFVRLGSSSRTHPLLVPYSEHTRTKACKTTKELEKVYNDARVIAVTCLGSSHPVLSKRYLDVCIVDECTQVLQPTLIRPLSAAKTFVLVGDPEQLPPIVRNVNAIELGMAESLFDRLKEQGTTVSLSMNYRMNKTITKLANDFTYEGDLLIGNDSVANGCLKLTKIDELKSINVADWILQTLDVELENSIKILDTGRVWNKRHNVEWLLRRKNQSEEEIDFKNKCLNVFEAAVIFNLVIALLKGGVEAKDIGVIATYNDQVSQLSSILQKHNIDVNTVDRFQGRDKSVILYSCTKSEDPSLVAKTLKFEIMEDKRRLNVAITRAKHKLVIVGDLGTVKRFSTFSRLLSCINSKHIIELSDNVNGFNWFSVLNLEISE